MFQTYFDSIQNQFIAENESSELTYRTSLEILLNSFEVTYTKRNLLIKHEPTRQADNSRPDYKVITKEQLTIGLIETKKIGEDLNKILNTKQLTKYKELSDNIILTDYLHFILIKKGEPTYDVTLFSDYNLKNKKFKVETERIEDLSKLLRMFFEAEPETIYNSQDLAVKLSEKARFLKEFSFVELKSATDENTNLLFGLYNVFKDSLLPLLEKDYFSDIYAQTLTYGLFISALNCDNPRVQLNKDTAYSFLPTTFPLIRELFHSIDDFPKEIIWIINELICILKVTDYSAIRKEFSEYRNKEQGFSDPFIYFYEDFLKHYDKKQRELRGVYYTPEPVVSFIVRSIEEILKEDFGIKDGLINKEITALDFASGTGTFLLYLYKQAIDQALKIADKETVNKILNEQIIKNFYGFELLVAPYVVAHLKISEFFKEQGFSIDSDNRLNIFLTNTLTNQEPQPFPILPNLTKEGKEANRIKNKDILIILGNPPYSIHSDNIHPWIINLLKDYKPTDEKKLNIDDDYIKFIRFAHWKMQNAERGIVGVITNNSFLNGLIHRKMRSELLNEFDSIYILNLHGNSRINERSPDGSKDENLFDIMQGVSISIFIKNSNKKNKMCKLFYKDLWGKREYKKSFLMNNSINNVQFDEIQYDSFNKMFKKTKWGTSRFKDDLNFFVSKRFNGELSRYGNWLGIIDIFEIYGSGFSTDREKLFIDYNFYELQKRMIILFSNKYDESFKNKYNINDSSGYNLTQRIVNINFTENDIVPCNKKPFDKKFVFYKIGVTSRPVYEVSKHFFNKNIGIVFSRLCKSSEYTNVQVSDCIIDRSFNGKNTGSETYIAPLFKYCENDYTNGNGFLYKEDGKRDNFTKEFRQFIKSKYQNQYAPEQILAYVYAILHSPTYRSKYQEFLKIDFPRIPFTDDEELFREISEIGSELVAHHLLKETYSNNICKICGTGTNYKVDNIEYDKGKVWFNKERYFEPVPENIWNFVIGGYQVLEKWLKERKKQDYVLLTEDIQHFIKMVDVLNTTINIMERIDDLTSDWI